MIKGNLQYFDFKYSVTKKLGQIPDIISSCIIVSLGREATVNQDFDVVKSNMPLSWIKPVLDKLRVMLKNKTLNP